VARDAGTGVNSGRKIAIDRLPALDRLNDVLRGPVVDIFLTHVPAFQGFNRKQAYELVMNNPQLADECFKLFRKRPELFEHVLAGPDGTVVTDEERPLSCGHTLRDVTAMVVRAVARRHFLSRFAPGSPPEPAPEQAPAWFRRSLLRLFRKPPPAAKAKRKATRGDSLYRAMRHHLLYDWQLPLIPHYTPLPVSLVRRLGARILDYRSPMELRVLLLEGPSDKADVSAEVASAPPSTGSGPPSGRAAAINAKASAMWTISQTLGLAKLFEIDEVEMRRTVVRASAASGSVITSLGAAGLKMRNLVVVLCTFDRRLGHARMPVLFGSRAHPTFIAALAEHIQREGIADLHDPKEIRNRTETIIAAMQKMRQMPP
jgi:hypothetical protein